MRHCTEALNLKWKHVKLFEERDLQCLEMHALAIQMGTSIGMIERHYSHLTPRLKKDMLTGKRYELSRDEFADQHDTREL